jgi:hypothetical protein
MRKIIPKLVIYFLALKVTVMMIVIAVDRKQIRELKDKYQISINTVDSLYKQSVDPSVLWFQNEVPEEYEVMEHAIMKYSWGKEIVTFFKYKDDEEL